MTFRIFPLLFIFLAACSHQEKAPPPSAPAPVKAAALPDLSARDAADRAVERRVREILELSGVSSFDVFVRSRAGRVQLSGEVNSAATAASLVNVTKGLRHVRAVESDLTVRAAAPVATTTVNEESGFPWGWTAGLLAALALGFLLGRRRRGSGKVVANPAARRAADVTEIRRERAS